jgi:Transposase IS66 family
VSIPLTPSSSWKVWSLRCCAGNRLPPPARLSGRQADPFSRTSEPAKEGHKRPLRPGDRDDKDGLRGAAELIGKDYAGRLVRDGWGPYRGFEKAVHQTCIAHLLRRCKELLEAAWGRGREIPGAIRTILLDALRLRDRRDAGEIDEQGFQIALLELRVKMLAQLARPVRDSDFPTGRLLRHLDREFDALFSFLMLPGLPATNCMAEQVAPLAPPTAALSG